MTIQLTPGRTSLTVLRRVYEGEPIALDPAARPQVEAAADLVAVAASGDVGVYALA